MFADIRHAVTAREYSDGAQINNALTRGGSLYYARCGARLESITRGWRLMTRGGFFRRTIEGYLRCGASSLSCCSSIPSRSFSIASETLIRFDSSDLVVNSCIESDGFPRIEKLHRGGDSDAFQTF